MPRLRWSALKLTDDRGKSWAVDPVHKLDIPAPLADRITRETRDQFGRSSLYLGILAGAIALVALTMSVVTTWVPQFPPGYAMPAGMLLVIVIIRFNPWTRRRLSQLRQSSAATIKAALRCPACGYGLRSLHPAADGCTECSECGAAWRLDESTQIDDERDVPTVVSRAASHYLGTNTLSIVDAAGRSVRLAFPIVFLSPPRCWLTVPRVQQKRIQRRLWRIGLVARLFLLPIALAAATLWIFTALGRIPSPASATTLTGVGSLVWGMLSSIFPLLISLFFLWTCIRPDIGKPEKIRDVWLAEGRCPTCANRLDWPDAPASAQPAEPPPHVRCDTCGSVWSRPASAPRAGAPLHRPPKG